MITEDAENVMTQAANLKYILSHAALMVPFSSCNEVSGTKIRYSRPGRNAFLKSSREYLKVLQLRALPPAALSTTSGLERPPPMPLLPGASQGHQESVCCILPPWPLSYVAMHQLYSAMEWNLGETEGLSPETCFSLEYAVLGVL